MTTEERRAQVAARDLDKVREADRRRSQEPARKAYNNAASARRRREQADKVRARMAVFNALASGRLVRGACEEAGADCRGQVEAHHDDYGAPLDVRWLCKEHHERWHVENDQTHSEESVA
jgi:hypothetical protein